jgi:class 3 adenylate cyclase
MQVSAVMPPISIEQVADRAGADLEFVHRLIDLGAIGPADDGYAQRDVHVVALLHLWERAGLSSESILAAVDAGELSLDFLETPAWSLPEHLPLTYREFAENQRIPLRLLQGIHESIGFSPPDPEYRVRPDDAVMVELVRAVLDMGASEETVLRLFRLYADNLSRLATAEAQLYMAEVERGFSEAGADESELMRTGSELGRRIARPVQETLRAIYDRHRQHVWAERSIERAEVVLERAGLYERAARTPAICFVDLTGYTRLTEERGDEAAARLASGLAALVQDISRRHGGRPIRWLGDGGMFYFKEAIAAVLAGLEMAEEAPKAGLPPTHIGIQAGPVIFRDGDVYGRTVNIASRIADRAQAGEVLTSEETVEQIEGSPVRFEAVASVELKGLSRPITLYRAAWDDRSPPR